MMVQAVERPHTVLVGHPLMPWVRILALYCFLYSQPPLVRCQHRVPGGQGKEYSTLGSC